MGRSTSEVRRKLAANQRERDRIISAQSFYCSRKHRLVTPSQCHDCFAALPYTERLLRWAEDRKRCIEYNHRKPETPEAGTELSAQIPRKVERFEKKKISEEFLEDYVSQNILDFILELDSLTDRFGEWWVNLADPARMKIRKDRKLQEAVAWLGMRLDKFRQSVLMICRSPEEVETKNHTKEEQCGVKN